MLEIVKETFMALSFGIVALAVYIGFRLTIGKMGKTLAIIGGVVMFFVAIAGGVFAVVAVDGLFAKLFPPAAYMTDKAIYSEFYNDIMTTTKEFDELYMPFSSYLEDFDLVRATIYAKRSESKLYVLKNKIASIEAPKVANKEAYENFKEARELIADGYASKYYVMIEYIEFAKNPTIDVVANMRVNANRYQSQIVMGLAALLSAGESLGLNHDEIFMRQNAAGK